MPISEVASREGRFLAKVRDDFIDTYDREPSEMELADMTGYTLKKVNKILNRDSVRSDSSMINDESHESTFTSKDVTDDDYYNYVYASVGPTDQKIMDWASGRGGKIISNMEIAKRLRVTPAAVSQRKAKIQKLMSEVRGLV
jgi:DNA-directed RNA polymerase specialized sigma subunit